MDNFSLLFSLPETLHISIAIIVAKTGAAQQCPLIVSGKRGMILAFNTHVLRATSVEYPALHPNFFNEDSKFRAFVFRCVLSGNLKACYLESLRLAITYGALEASAQLLRNIVSPDQ
ncbi:unnamed protein product [Arabis nemorensis]|uniref:Uncharacterized protein n=1 Tax=Arabis nemorensis TaxID=586526 RepID=A0A565BLN7_9BRAS|nr:unnamed protein product [Arabis nemorensis]